MAPRRPDTTSDDWLLSTAVAAGRADQRHAATHQKKDHHRKDISHDGAHVR
jgi:hypothetical protein